MKLTFLYFSTNYIYKYANECSLQLNVVVLARLLNLGFVIAISVSSVERSKLGNIINISSYLKRQLSILSFSTIYLQFYHGRCSCLIFFRKLLCSNVSHKESRFILIDDVQIDYYKTILVFCLQT